MGSEPSSGDKDGERRGKPEAHIDSGGAKNTDSGQQGYRQRLRDILGNLNFWIALGTWALAVVGWFALKSTNHLAKKQTELTRKQIHILETQLAPNLTIHWKPLTTTDKNGTITQWLVTPTIQNSGTTRAVKFSGWADAHAFPRPLNGWLGVDCTVPYHRLIPTGPQIIAGQSSVELDTVILSRQDMMNAESHKTMYMMWMRATFMDEFHPAVTHHLGESIEVSPHEIGGKTELSFVISPTECVISD